MTRKSGSSKIDQGAFSPFAFPNREIAGIKFTGVRQNPFGDLIYRARVEGKPLRLGTNISLVGDSTLADLVALFGYSTGQMRRESLNKVLKQLLRAGLEISPETDRWSRDDKFKVSPPSVPPPDDNGDDDEDDDDEATNRTRRNTQRQPSTCLIHSGRGLWDSIQGGELEFLRALSESEPILCLLHLPTEAQTQVWIQGTWEGITGWAFRGAQRFIRWLENSTPDAKFVSVPPRCCTPISNLRSSTVMHPGWRTRPILSI